MAKQKKVTIGEVLKAARIKLGLDASEVGERVNVSRSRVYMWEAGDYVMPKNLGPLSTALDIPKKTLEKVNGTPP